MRLLQLSALFVFSAITGVAQISITGLSSDLSAPLYSENFNTFAGTAISVPSGWTISANTGALNYKGTGTGSSSTGGIYAFGTAGEYALGVLHSGSSTTENIPTFGVSFTNNSGATITSVTFKWNYEQWRYVNTSGFTLTGTGLNSANLSSYSFSGISTGTNGTVTSTSVSVTLTNLSISNGSTFGLSWKTTDATGSDNGVAIDDFSLAATAVPEPATYAAIFGGMALLGAAVHRRRSRRAAVPAATPVA